MAYRVPLVTFSTKCVFSEPDVKNDKRPGRRNEIKGILQHILWRQLQPSRFLVLNEFWNLIIYLKLTLSFMNSLDNLWTKTIDTQNGNLKHTHEYPDL